MTMNVVNYSWMPNQCILPEAQSGNFRATMPFQQHLLHRDVPFSHPDVFNYWTPSPIRTSAAAPEPIKKKPRRRRQNKSASDANEKSKAISNNEKTTEPRPIMSLKNKPENTALVVSTKPVIQNDQGNVAQVGFKMVQPDDSSAAKKNYSAIAADTVAASRKQIILRQLTQANSETTKRKREEINDPIEKSACNSEIATHFTTADEAVKQQLDNKMAISVSDIVKKVFKNDNTLNSWLTPKRKWRLLAAEEKYSAQRKNETNGFVSDCNNSETLKDCAMYFLVSGRYAEFCRLVESEAALGGMIKGYINALDSSSSSRSKKNIYHQVFYAMTQSKDYLQDTVIDRVRQRENIQTCGHY